MFCLKPAELCVSDCTQLLSRRVLTLSFLLTNHKTFLSCTGGASSPEGPSFGPSPGCIDTVGVKEVMCSCERGVVVMLDRQMAVLSRVWPLYEVRHLEKRKEGTSEGCVQKTV
jgi:hypothetical protein